MIVLGALVVGMTLISGLLFVLEPGPVAPFTGITLQSVEYNQSPESRLFDLDTASPRPWKAIVIHDSGRLSGSARTLDERHKAMGREGLGYHFVVDNGTEGQKDGVIEVGYRWQHQETGDYLAPSENTQWFHNNAVGISLVGDADRKPFTQAQLHELVWLVQKLQRRFNIPADAVYVQVGSGEVKPAFPSVWFRDQLLTRRTP